MFLGLRKLREKGLVRVYGLGLGMDLGGNRVLLTGVPDERSQFLHWAPTLAETPTG